MESALWALNLLVVCFACNWALRKDTPPPKKHSSATEQPPHA